MARSKGRHLAEDFDVHVLGLNGPRLEFGPLGAQVAFTDHTVRAKLVCHGTLQMRGDTLRESDLIKPGRWWVLTASNFGRYSMRI